MDLYEEYIKKYLIDYKQEIFNNIIQLYLNNKINTKELIFFAFKIIKQRKTDDINVLKNIAFLFIYSERYIEAEYYLSKCYEMDKKNIKILYYLNEVFSKRHAFFHVDWSASEIQNISPNNILAIKARIKFLIMSGKINENINFLENNFKLLIQDQEGTILIFNISIKGKHLFLFYKIIISSNIINLLNNIPRRLIETIKKMLIECLIQQLKRLNEK